MKRTFPCNFFKIFPKNSFSALPKPRKQTAWCKGKPHDTTKFPTKRIVEKIANRDQIRFKIDDIDLSTLRPELLANMNETELKHLITAL